MKDRKIYSDHRKRRIIIGHKISSLWRKKNLRVRQGQGSHLLSSALLTPNELVQERFSFHQGSSVLSLDLICPALLYFSCILFVD